jgi:hypothetical protein
VEGGGVDGKSKDALRWERLDCHYSGVSGCLAEQALGGMNVFRGGQRSERMGEEVEGEEPSPERCLIDD